VPRAIFILDGDRASIVEEYDRNYGRSYFISWYSGKNVLKLLWTASVSTFLKIKPENLRQEVANPAESRAIIDMVSTIVVYQFIKLSRREVDEMLGIRLEETRVYQEAREDEARRSHLPNLAIEFGLWTY
jgi:hypothetical protein